MFIYHDELTFSLRHFPDNDYFQFKLNVSWITTSLLWLSLKYFEMVLRFVSFPWNQCIRVPDFTILDAYVFVWERYWIDYVVEELSTNKKDCRCKCDDFHVEIFAIERLFLVNLIELEKFLRELFHPHAACYR